MISRNTERTLTVRPHSSKKIFQRFCPFTLNGVTSLCLTFCRTVGSRAEICWRFRLQKLSNVQILKLLKLRWKRQPIKSRLCSQSNRVYAGRYTPQVISSYSKKWSKLHRTPLCGRAVRKWQIFSGCVFSNSSALELVSPK